MTGTDLVNDFRAETGATTSDVADAVVLRWIAEGLREYSRWRPRILTATQVVSLDVWDYAFPTGARSILDDGVRYLDDDGEEIPTAFTVFEDSDGKQIRLQGTPLEGETLRIYYRKDHVISALGDTLTIADGDREVMGVWLRAKWAEKKALTSAEAGKWKLYNREEDGGSTATGLVAVAKVLREQFVAALKVPAVVHTGGRPSEQGLPARGDQRSADRWGGSLGPMGPASRRKGV